MKIGPYLLLTMPGEPMVEYGFKLEKGNCRSRNSDHRRIRQRPRRIHRNRPTRYVVGGYEPNTLQARPRKPNRSFFSELGRSG